MLASSEWLVRELKNRIEQIDWREAKKDVARFLKPREMPVLDLWTRDFFLSRVEKLAGYL